ncbi:MAG: SH3 domain-containing protein [Marinoscillum sp.]
MKNPNLLIVLLLFAIACSSPQSEGETSEESTNDESEMAESTIEESPAVCIWDNISVRETPTAEGKWITSISVGESLTYKGIEAFDSLNKDRKYLKIQLNDGTEGWSIADFIVVDGEIGVFLEETFIYNRPDLLTKSDKKYERLDIIAVQNIQDDWQEIVGKRAEGKWIDSGWIKRGKLSFESIDIAVAKFFKEAVENEDETKQIEALNLILENPDLSESKIMVDVKSKYTELTNTGNDQLAASDSLKQSGSSDSLMVE